MKNINIKIFSILFLLCNQTYSSSFIKPLIISIATVFGYDKYKNCKEAAAHYKLMKYVLAQKNSERFFELLSECGDSTKTFWITAFLNSGSNEQIKVDYEGNLISRKVTPILNNSEKDTIRYAFYKFIENNRIPEIAADNIFKSNDIKAMQASIQNKINILGDDQQYLASCIWNMLQISDKKYYSSQANDFLSEKLLSLLPKQDIQYSEKFKIRTGNDFTEVDYKGPNQSHVFDYPMLSDEYKRFKRKSWMNEKLLEQLIAHNFISSNTGYHLALEYGYKGLAQRYMDLCIYDKLEYTSPERLLKIMHDYHNCNPAAMDIFYKTAHKTCMRSIDKNSSWHDYIFGKNAPKIQKLAPKVIRPEVMIETVLSSDFSISHTRSDNNPYGDEEYSFHNEDNEFSEKTFIIRNFLQYLADQEFVDPTACDSITELIAYQHITNGSPHPLLSFNFNKIIEKCSKKNIAPITHEISIGIENNLFRFISSKTKEPALIDQAAKYLLAHYSKARDVKKVENLISRDYRIDEESMQDPQDSLVYKNVLNKHQDKHQEILNIETRLQKLNRAVDQGFNQ